MIPVKLTPTEWALGGLLVLAVAGWMTQSVRLGEARRTAETVTAQHTRTLNELSVASSKLLAKTTKAQATYEQALPAILAAQEKAITDAKVRHEVLVAGIAAGNVRLRPQWQGDCPAPDGREAAPTTPAADPAQSRAAAVGRVLGIGAYGDATYATCYSALTETRALLRACYGAGEP